MSFTWILEHQYKEDNTEDEIDTILYDDVNRKEHDKYYFGSGSIVVPDPAYDCDSSEEYKPSNTHTPTDYSKSPPVVSKKENVIKITDFPGFRKKTENALSKNNAQNLINDDGSQIINKNNTEKNHNNDSNITGNDVDTEFKVAESISNDKFIVIPGFKLFNISGLSFIDHIAISQCKFRIQPLLFIDRDFDFFPGMQTGWKNMGKICNSETEAIGKPLCIINAGFIVILKEEEINEESPMFNDCDDITKFNQNSDIYVVVIYIYNKLFKPYCIPYKKNNNVVVRTDIQRLFTGYLLTIEDIISNDDNNKQQ